MHIRRHKVKHAHRRQPEHQLNGLHHAGLPIKRAINAPALRVRRHRQRHRPVSIDMVHPILRVVFHHQDRHVLPERTLGKALHHDAKRKVIIRLMRRRRAAPRRSSIGVITRQNHHHQVGHRLLGFPFLDVLGKNIGLQHVRDILRPRRIFAHQRAIERRNRRRGVVVLLYEFTEIGCVVRLPIAPLGQVLLPHGDVAILRRRRILAKHTDLLSLRLRAFP